MAIEQLINTGLGIIGKPRWRGPRSIVVIGPPRSGTSMVSGVLHHLGLFMGRTAAPPVYEDVHLSKAFESGDDPRTKEIIRDYLREHRRFGWKRPASIDQLERVDGLFHRPSYIFVFKDIYAIANRNRISMMSDILDNMEKTAEQYLNVARFIRKRRPHALLVSYEKVMLNRERFVEQIVAFGRLDCDASRVANAVGFIDPFPEAYLEASRIDRAQGRLVGVEKDGRLFGWARYVYQKTRKAVVDVYLNGKVIASVDASEAAESLGLGVKGACGFSLVLKTISPLKSGDIVRARVQGEVRDLDNSPLRVG